MSPVFSNSLIGSSGSQGGDADYQITNSLRFNSADSAYLTNTPTTAGNRKTFTWSGWIKRTVFGERFRLIVGGADNSNRFLFGFGTDDKLEILSQVGGTTRTNIKTNAVFRDPSAWYHIVLKFDATNTSAVIYVNGVSQDLTVSTAVANIDHPLNATDGHYIGRTLAGTLLYSNGYLADIYFIDGLALGPSAFGETDDEGIWQPKEYEGIYAGNSFHLPFSDRSSNTATTLGKNTSGIGKIAYNPITSATGAFPIYNTDSFGTLTSGTRLDDSSSNLVVALPLTDANDYSATVKGSGSNKTVTNNSVTFPTTHYKWYGQSASFSRSSSKYLSVADQSDIEFGSDNFTIECWLYLTNSIQQYEGIFSKPGPNDQQGILLLKEVSTNNINFLATIGSSGWQVALNFGSSASFEDKWVHIAIVRSGNVFSIYRDGVFTASTTVAGSIYDNSSPLEIGRYTKFPGNATIGFDGFMQDFRVYKGLAKYTENFVPSKPAGGLPIHNTTDDYGVVKGSGTRTDSFASNLVLALPMDGASGTTTFNDISATIKGSGSNKTVTANGNASISTAKSSFYGSSGYFDGTGDYLTLSGSTDFEFTGQFTIEYYLHLTSSSGENPVISWGNGSYKTIFVGSGQWKLEYPSTGVTLGGQVVSNTWVHYALTRDSDNIVRWFINGQLQSTNSISSTIGSTDTLYIGRKDNSGTHVTGHIQDLRIYKGAAKYTTDFVPPVRKDWTPVNLSISTGGPTSLSSTTAALPILNTTGAYGQTLDTGVRSDPFAAYLVYANVAGTSSGLNLTDQVPSGRTAAALTLTAASGVSSTTASSQYYGGSARLSGVAPSNITSSTSSDLAFLSSDYTIEYWFKRNGDGSNTNFETILDTRPVDTTDMPVFGVNSSNQIKSYGFPGGYGDQTHTNAYVRVGGWNHIAAVRSGYNHYIFCNGILIYSQSGTNSLATTSTRITVGDANSNVGVRYTFNGDVQDVRIYKGVAKYTSNFIVPTSTQFPAVASEFDALLDSPTNYGTDTGLGGEVKGNYCTWNPISNSVGALSNGNLTLGGTSSGFTRCNGTIAVSSGKWYFETTLTAVGTTDYTTIGIAQGDITGQYPGQDALSYAYTTTRGSKINNNSQPAYGSALVAGDILMVAFDLDNNKMFFGKNGTWMDSSNPVTGANPVYTLTPGTYKPIARPYDSSAIINTNFGQRPFAYTAPSGFKALCTQNLPTPPILDGSNYFDTKLYTGNGGTQTISGLEFSPDLVWIKQRSSTEPHVLSDSVRGSIKSLYSNTTGFEETEGPRAYTSDGFTLGSGWYVNRSGSTYVGWNWDAGNPSSPTTGAVAFDGSGDYLQLAYNSDWDLSNSDFTIEAFINSTDTTTNYPSIIGRWQAAGQALWDVRPQSTDAGDNFFFIYNDGSQNISINSGAFVCDGGWHHLAVTRSGTNLYMFVDGDLKATHNIGTATIKNDTNIPLYIGYDPYGASYYNGFISNLRLIKGTALYTSNFTPPSTELTNVSNTKLLCCQSSTSATTAAESPVTITANGNSAATTYNPLDAFSVNGAGYSTAAAAGITQGTIPLLGASVNRSAGFSIVSYRGNGGSDVSVGHGLNTTPTLLICKSRTAAADWDVTYTFEDGSYDFLTLNNIDAKADITGRTAPNSTTFYVNGGNSNVSNVSYVAYCFAPVAGYSAFGSYTGNGLADGNFIYLGFRPRWILVKRSSATSNWDIFDTERGTYNSNTPELQPNTSTAETSVTDRFDILSNGFKLRSTLFPNGSGVTFIYAAFAENPFKLARAR